MSSVKLSSFVGSFATKFTVNKVVLVDLVLPQVIWSVLVLAIATGVRAGVNLWWAIAVHDLLVLSHAAAEPLGSSLRTVVAEITLRNGVGCILTR